MENLFFEISIILLAATVVAVVMRLLKQPLVLGHILTGIIVGPAVLNYIHSFHEIEALAKFGISILLFIVGLGLSPKVVRDVGKIAVITGVSQITFTSFFGFLITRLLGYDVVSSLYIAIAVSFSSTIIILKLLTDRGDVEKLYGRIAIGFLLVQDLVATLILLGVSTFAGSSDAALNGILLVLLKGGLILAAISFISSKFLPKLSDFFASSGELLFLFSIGWGFGLAILFQYIGFSLEIGALLAGVTLSFTPYSQEIGSRLKPLRDFFLVIFFVLLGAKLTFTNIGALLTHATVIGLFVLIGNPLVVMSLLGISGYNKKTGFMAGLTVAQISEFSLILVVLGVQVGHISESVLSLLTMIALVTIAGSTYMIIYADKLYSILKKHLSFFEKSKTKKEYDLIDSYDVVLFGGNRMGYDFIETFKKLGQGFLCVDYDPKIVKQLSEDGINCRYGDVEDGEFLEEINVNKAKMVINTIPDMEANLFLLEFVKHNTNVIVFMISHSIDDALVLYENGADYVILPHFIGGRVVADMIEEVGFNTEHFDKKKESHISYLKERKSLGHTHPTQKLEL